MLYKITYSGMDLTVEGHTEKNAAGKLRFVVDDITRLRRSVLNNLGKKHVEKITAIVFGKITGGKKKAKENPSD